MIRHCFIVLLFSCSFASAQNPVAICREMFGVIAAMNTVSLKMESYERIGDKYITTKFLVKRSRKPLNVYYKQSFPVDGAEVLLNSNGKVLVNPGTFPWITMEMDINSSLLRKDQHHGIMESGYDYFVLLMSELFRKYADSLSKNVILEKTETINNKSCYKISLNNPAYKIYTYKVTKDETILSIAGRLKISEYKICELNNKNSVSEKIQAGTGLKLPTDYAKSMILWIDTKMKIPLKMEVYDEKGLYEKYVFNEVVINPVFKNLDFEKDNPDYKFK